MKGNSKFMVISYPKMERLIAKLPVINGKEKWNGLRVWKKKWKIKASAT
jgi:hypothetical protein